MASSRPRRTIPPALSLLSGTPAPPPIIKQSRSPLASTSHPVDAYTDVVPIIPRGPPSKSHSAPRSPNHTKRPPNSWILYRSDTLKNIKQARSEGREFIVPEAVRAHPKGRDLSEGGDGLPKAQSKASKLISLMWSMESEAVKNKFDALAEVRKVEHARQFPQYKFQPKRSEGSKISTSAVTLSRPGASSRTSPRARPPPLSIDPSQSRQLAVRSQPPPHPYARAQASSSVDEYDAGRQTALSSVTRSEKSSRRKKRSSTSSKSSRSQTPVQRPDWETLTSEQGQMDAFAAGYAAAQQYAPEVSWSVPLPANASAGWNSAPYPAGARNLGLGVEGWEGFQEVRNYPLVDQRQHSVQRPYRPTYISPSLSSDSFDSHPTPSCSTLHLAKSNPETETSVSEVQYGEYDYTPPWPNPAEECGPADIIRHQYYDWTSYSAYPPQGGPLLPVGPSYPSYRHSGYGDIPLGDAHRYSTPPPPVVAHNDPNGLAAMWSLLDDTASGDSPFAAWGDLIDPPDTAVSHGHENPAPWEIEGEWNINISLPASVPATLDLAAEGLHVSLPFDEDEFDTAAWVRADDNRRRAETRAQRVPEPPSPIPHHGPIEEETESVTKDFASVNVGGLRRTRRIVGGTFRPPSFLEEAAIEDATSSSL